MIDPSLIRGCLGGVKVCNTCKTEKPEAEFRPYKKRGAYTRWYVCMACERDDSLSRKRLDQKKMRKRRASSYAEMEKNRARLQARYAILRGTLIRPAACERCGSEPPPTHNGSSAIQAHHHDYSKPLDVRWLCKHCHVIEHRERLAGPPVPQPPTAPADLVARLKEYGKKEYQYALLGKGSLDTIIKDLLSDAVEAGMEIERLRGVSHD